MMLYQNAKIVEPKVLYLKTLTPLHIGSGEELTPLDYMVINQQFFRINQSDLLQKIEKLGLVDQYGEWITECMREIQMAQDNRSLAEARNKMNPLGFFQTADPDQVSVFVKQYENQGLALALDERLRAQYGRNIKQHIPSLGQVREAVKTGPDKKPYLPGSSLKGSLRTALFYYFLDKYGQEARITELLDTQLRKNARKERFALPLVHEAFFCKTIDNGREKLDDEKMDLLKLVHLSDAQVQGAGTRKVAKFNIYLVEAERNRRGEKPNLRATMQPQTSYCEMLAEEQDLRASIRFDIQFLLQAKTQLRGGDRIGPIWIGIKTKVKQLFNLDIETLTPENCQEKHDAVIQHLLDCWHRFSTKQMAKQGEWLDNFKIHDRGDEYSTKITRGLNKVQTSADASLLHLGFGTGFWGMTALLYFMEHSRLQDLYKKILEKFNVGNRPGNRSPYRLNLERFPKSRRLIDEPGQIYFPGWLSASLTPGAITVTPQPIQSTTVPSPQAVPSLEPSKPIEPAFPTRPLKSGKRVELDAVVTVSGIPNKVKVFVREGYTPELPLMALRNKLPEGTVIVVNAMPTGKLEVVQVDYVREKK